MKTLRFDERFGARLGERFEEKICDCFGGASKRAAHPACGGQKAISIAAMLLLCFAILFSSGCTGVTGASKNSSSQQTPGGATISVQPASINFGSVPLGDTVSQSVIVANGGTANLTITQVSAASAGITIAGVSLPLTIAPGNQSMLSIVFSPKTAGVLSGNVSILTDQSTSTSTVSLRGIGMAATAFLSVNSSTLSFGNVTVGKGSELGVTLTNAGNSSVSVSKVTVSGASYTASGVSSGLILATGQSVVLNATFTPTATGTAAGSVTVASNATNSPATIALTGTGVAAGAHSVTLNWTPSVSVVAGYDVYRSEVSGGPYTKLDSTIVTGTTYTDQTVQAGVTYYYVVTSTTAAGVQSADSAQISVTIPTT